jgi:rare lipoprotein A
MRWRGRAHGAALALLLAGCAHGYSRVGLASWYGASFAGRPTASGELFDPAALTAAHRTLPLGTIARVTALSTGRHVDVTVNDRGPVDHRRLIDLSRGAAEALGTRRAGLARVRVRAIGKRELLPRVTRAPAPVRTVPTDPAVEPR